MIRIGDIVKISRGSGYYLDKSSAWSEGPIDYTNHNPRNTCGKVLSLKSYGLPISVRWDNGLLNVYDHHDLDVVESPLVRQISLKKVTIGKMGRENELVTT